MPGHLSARHGIGLCAQRHAIEPSAKAFHRRNRHRIVGAGAPDQDAHSRRVDLAFDQVAVACAMASGGRNFAQGFLRLVLPVSGAVRSDLAADGHSGKRMLSCCVAGMPERRSVLLR